MGMFMKASGKIIKLLEKEFLLKQMEDNIMAIGQMINSMDMERKFQRMAQNIKDNLFLEFVKAKQKLN